VGYVVLGETHSGILKGIEVLLGLGIFSNLSFTFFRIISVHSFGLEKTEKSESFRILNPLTGALSAELSEVGAGTASSTTIILLLSFRDRDCFSYSDTERTC